VNPADVRRVTRLHAAYSGVLPRPWRKLSLHVFLMWTLIFPPLPPCDVNTANTVRVTETRHLERNSPHLGRLLTASLRRLRVRYTIARNTSHIIQLSGAAKARSKLFFINMLRPVPSLGQSQVEEDLFRRGEGADIVVLTGRHHDHRHGRKEGKR
jgi:hypothetical protein